MVSKVSPVYPQTARMAHVTGSVEVSITVGVDGSVVRVQAVSGPQLLRAAAEEAVRRWRYEPAQVDGKPVQTDGRVTVAFGGRE